MRARLAVLAFVGALLVLASPPAAALLNRAPPKKAEPTFPIQDENSFKAAIKVYHAMPFRNPKFEFDVLLPRDWTVDSPPPEGAAGGSFRVLQGIATFKGPVFGIANPVLRIEFMRLERDVTAEDWLKIYVFGNSRTLEGKIESSGVRRASGAFTSVADGKSTFTYAVVQINGDIAMLASFDIPLWARDDLGFVQKRTVDSFRLVSADDAPVEEQESYTLADALTFSYPKSWSLHDPDFRDTSNISVQLHNAAPGGRLNGLIRFVAVRRGDAATLVREIEKLRVSLKDALGVEAKTLASTSALDAPPRFLFARQENYRVALKNPGAFDQELRLVILGDRRWYVFLMLLTPPEAENFPVWAQNRRAFDLILSHLR